MRIVATNLKTVRRFICSVCEQDFCSNSELQLHKLIHGEERPFTGDTCSSKASKKRNKYLKKRKQLYAHEDKHVCEYCDKISCKNTYLQTHLKPPAGGEHFTCSVCGNMFRSRRSYRAHMLIHCDGNPFNCKSCGKCFSRSYNFRLHCKRVHEMEQAFECSKCSKSFKLWVQLIDHKRVCNEIKEVCC